MGSEMCIRDRLRVISVHESKKEGVAYASEAFTFTLYGGVRPQNMLPRDAPPSWRLAKLFDRCLPEWRTLFEKRWSPLDALQLSDYCADAAFLNMVSMYKRMLGYQGFPSDVFEWPPKKWLAKRHARERKPAAGDGATGLVGEASRSAGSPAPAAASVRRTHPKRELLMAAADDAPMSRRMAGKRTAKDEVATPSASRDEPPAKSRPRASVGGSSSSRSGSSTAPLPSSSSTVERSRRPRTSSTPGPAVSPDGPADIYRKWEMDVKNGKL